MDDTWKTKAECLKHVELFQEQTQLSASEGTPKDQRTAVGLAKQICTMRCPVREACLESAMATELFLGGTERHGIRGGLTARERILIAAQDPMCARCRTEPVASWQRVIHIKRLCRKCQGDVLDHPEQRYFPELVDRIT